MAIAVGIRATGQHVIVNERFHVRAGAHASTFRSSTRFWGGRVAIRSQHLSSREEKTGWTLQLQRTARTCRNGRRWARQDVGHDHGVSHSRVVRCAATFSLAARTLALEDRLTAAGGDFFKSVLAGGNVYLLRYILHDWNDAECVQVLQNCRVATIQNAKLLCSGDSLGTVGADDLVVPMQDLNMLAVLHGRERTLAEFDKLFDRAG